MFKLIFTRDDGRIEIGKAKTKDEALKHIADAFVRFCRDVSHRPLERTQQSKGFTWAYHGTIYGLFYEEDVDG